MHAIEASILQYITHGGIKKEKLKENDINNNSNMNDIMNDENEI